MRRANMERAALPGVFKGTKVFILAQQILGSRQLF